MLINLCATVEELAAEDRSEIENFFSELLRSSFLGFHMIIINRTICNWAREFLNLGDRDKAHLDRLRELFTQRGSLPSSARSIVEIEVGSGQLSQTRPHRFRIGHKQFVRGAYLERTQFLVEHIENDGEFFRVALNQVRRTHPIKNFDFRVLHGGGADIAACLRAELPNRHIVVTVVDSDKAAPCDTPSATMRNLERESGRQTYIGLLCETPCRELENFIPLSLLRTHRARICPEFPSFEVLENLFDTQVSAGAQDCLWLYFDIKKGIEAPKLDAIASQTVQNWLREKYQLGDGSFSDIRIRGFGEGVLRSFLNCGEAMRGFAEFMQSSYWNLHFFDFFDVLYWYFAADQKLRTI